MHDQNNKVCDHLQQSQYQISDWNIHQFSFLKVESSTLTLSNLRNLNLRGIFYSFQGRSSSVVKVKWKIVLWSDESQLKILFGNHGCHVLLLKRRGIIQLVISAQFKN